MVVVVEDGGQNANVSESVPSSGLECRVPVLHLSYLDDFASSPDVPEHSHEACEVMRLSLDDFRIDLQQITDLSNRRLRDALLNGVSMTIRLFFNPVHFLRRHR
jgi:hypothetical protein